MKKKYKILSLSLVLIIVLILGIYLATKTKSSQENTQVEQLTNDSNKTMLHGNIKIIENFYSPELDNNKTLRIYLPYGYESNNIKYPVIYMQDGQNLFDTKTASYNMEWGVDEALDELSTVGKTTGAIVVGVDSVPETRENEYNPFIGQRESGTFTGGKGNKYAEFIVNTLKPYIDTNYRTLSDKSNTAIVGSSYGAVISLYTAIEYNDKFGMVGVFSFYGYLNPEDMDNYLKNNLSSDKLNDTKIYFYVGRNDFAYNSTHDAYSIAKQNKTKDIVYEEDDGQHNELSWNPRFRNCFEFFGL